MSVAVKIAMEQGLVRSPNREPLPPLVKCNCWYASNPGETHINGFHCPLCGDTGQVEKLPANRECGKFAVVGVERRDDKGVPNFDVQIQGTVWTSTIGTLELARQHLKETAENFPGHQFAIVQFLEVLE